MNNYVYYDIFLVKTRCERWRPAPQTTAFYSLTSTGFEPQQFPNRPQGGLFAARACWRRGALLGREARSHIR
ncbi:hypothetical protein QUB70_20340 [Microcoleus sp. A003_D6]|uniref:hypothetical protein n=1 Tax=Microcoleus sp. A003_D6 TaxID=3055266 RepID=UPI002FD4A37F